MTGCPERMLSSTVACAALLLPRCSECVLNHKFGYIADALEDLPDETVLDGDLVRRRTTIACASQCGSSTPSDNLVQRRSGSTQSPDPARPRSRWPPQPEDPAHGHTRYNTSSSIRQESCGARRGVGSGGARPRKSFSCAHSVSPSGRSARKQRHHAAPSSQRASAPLSAVTPPNHTRRKKRKDPGASSAN